jgi:glycosyltransferase involved in cell wall biosynthesis
MRVSVIIPTYNCSRFVTEAVDSVLAQTLPPAEVIVVDDGSSDDTESVLRPYADRIRYIRKENGGVSTARNAGLRAATSELIAFLDADDVWHPRKLEIQLACLRDDRALGLLGTLMTDWPHEQFSKISDGSGGWNTVMVPFEVLAVKNVIATSTVIVRREVVAQVGEFDSSLHGPEDYDFWLRCLQVTRAANVDLRLTGYRMVAGSLGKRAASMEAGMRRILEKLDKAKAWQGRWLLRRKAYGYTLYSCSYMYSAAGRQVTALGRLLRSLTCYPLPFRRGEVNMSLARPRLLITAILRTMRIKRPAPAQAPALAAPR